MPLFALSWSEFICFPSKGQFLASYFIAFAVKIIPVNIFFLAFWTWIGCAAWTGCFPVNWQQRRILIGTSIAGKGGTVSHVISDQLLHIQTAFQSFSVHSGRIYMHTTFRSGIGTVPYRYRCGRELNLAAFPEPHKIAETGFITLASHSVHKCVTATFMLFRTTHHFTMIR